MKPIAYNRKFLAAIGTELTGSSRVVIVGLTIRSNPDEGPIYWGYDTEGDLRAYEVIGPEDAVVPTVLPLPYYLERPAYREAVGHFKEAKYAFMAGYTLALAGCFDTDQ